jgi:hypothetical protein
MRARYLGQFYCFDCSAELPAQAVWEWERRALCRKHFTSASGQAPPRPRDATDIELDRAIEPDPIPRHRCGRDLTIERTNNGGVRLVRWRQVQDIGTVAETVHEWTAGSWVECVVFVSARRDESEANRTLVLTEVERIHAGR